MSDKKQLALKTEYLEYVYLCSTGSKILLHVFVLHFKLFRSATKHEAYKNEAAILPCRSLLALKFICDYCNTSDIFL